MQHVLLILLVVINEVDEEAFTVEQINDCPWDLYPRSLHARIGDVNAAYLTGIVDLEEV